MADEKKTGLDHLRDEIEKEILDASDEELREDALAAGDDIQGFAADMRARFSRAKEEAGRKRISDARAALERDRSKSAENVVPMGSKQPAKWPSEFVPDTMAARHEKDLSQRDKSVIQYDIDELFDDSAWDDEKSDDDR